MDVQTIIAMDVKGIEELEIKPDLMKMEYAKYTPLQQHLTDHDYINTRPSPRSRKSKKHIKITELKAVYNCITCGFKSMSRDVLFQHVCADSPKYILHRNINKKLPVGYQKCPVCDFSTKKMSNLNLHIRTHKQGVPLKCTECNISKNSSSTNYKCPSCYYYTKNLTSLKVHMHIHSRGTLYKCTECSYSGRDWKELIKHYDEVKDLKCSCGYTTHVKQQMVAHKRSHTGEKPFSCGICSFSTGARAGLHVHMKKHNP